MTARDEILQAAHELTGRGVTPFTAQDVVDELQRRGCDYAERTIRTHVTSRMCHDSPDHHATTYADLRRVGRGRYELAGGSGTNHSTVTGSSPSLRASR